MWMFDILLEPKSESEKLQWEILELIKNNIHTYEYDIGWFSHSVWTIDIWNNFSLYINSYNGEIKRAHIEFNNNNILRYCCYSDGYWYEFTSFYKIISKMFFAYEEKKKQEQKERSILREKTLISEALAHLLNQRLSWISKEVKEEFSPIFQKVKRVQEITQELKEIRKEFSII